MLNNFITKGELSRPPCPRLARRNGTRCTLFVKSVGQSHKSWLNVIQFFLSLRDPIEKYEKYFIALFSVKKLGVFPHNFKIFLTHPPKKKIQHATIINPKESNIVFTFAWRPMSLPFFGDIVDPLFKVNFGFSLPGDSY